MTISVPFVCQECGEPRPLYKDCLCKECWGSWQEWIDHIAASDAGCESEDRK